MCCGAVSCGAVVVNAWWWWGFASDVQLCRCTCVRDLFDYSLVVWTAVMAPRAVLGGPALAPLLVRVVHMVVKSARAFAYSGLRNLVFTEDMLRGGERGSHPPLCPR